MSTNRHDRISELFLQAAELEGEERSAFIDRACQGDPELRCQLESLLAHDEPAPAFLETGSMVRRAREALDSAPERIGPFRIAEKVGEGGMGVVYRAEQQEPIRRQVAIKLIKLGMESRQVLRRFDAERQALALMDHPHIARVLDAGVTEEGRPFFAMEYVQGEPITEFCDRHQLSIEQRLRLMLQVCEAVQHAHRNAIIHRDLKPSNVLVAMMDERPVPKVIDFGIAKALGQERDDATATRFGQVLGTLEYMSPEQAALVPERIDTRADVYSLGALLYELLVGSPPFDLALTGTTSLDELRRRIRDEDPPAPSARLAGLGGDAPPIAAARGSTRSSLMRQLRGDLDCIAGKALANDRSRRYESAFALAADLNRYLNNEPIEARPPGGLYRFGKLVGRHRVAAAVVAVLIPLLIGFSVTMTVQARRISRERDRAEEMSEFLVGFYDVPFFVLERHERPTAEDVLLRSAEKIDRSLEAHPYLQARLTHQMGRTLGAIGRSEKAESMLQWAHDRLEEMRGPEHPRTLAALHDLAMVRWARRAPDAESMMIEAFSARRATLGDRHAETLRAMVDLGHVYKRAHRFGDAARWLERAVDGMRDVLGADHEETLVATSLLAAVYLDLERFDDAQALLDAQIPPFGEGESERCIAIYNMATIHAARHERERALDLLGRAQDCGFRYDVRKDPNWTAFLDDPEFIDLVKQSELHWGVVRADAFRLAKVYGHRGRFDEAVKLYRVIVDSAVPPALERTEWPRSLSLAYLEQGRPDEAERIIQEQLDRLRRDPVYEPDLAESLWFLVQAKLALGDREGALAALDEQDAIYKRHYLAPRYPRVVRAAILGDRETALGELHEAVRRGFWDVRRLQQDLALDELRGTPEFEAIIAEVKQRSWIPTDLDLDELQLRKNL